MSRNLLIDALGATVRIDLEKLSDADADAVRGVWRDALASPVVERATRDGNPERCTVVAPMASAVCDAVLEDLSQRVTLAAIEQRRGELWMLHAAGVAAEDGRVVVLVGASGRGKTTAARTLGEHFGYVSDETVAIDDEGRVWPYRKPLSVIERPGTPKAQPSPSELGLRPLPDAPLRLAAIVLLDRDDDAPAHAVIEHMELGDALEDLVTQSSYLTAMPAPLHSMAALASAVGGIRRVRYRDATALRRVIDALLAEPRPTVSLAGGGLGEFVAGAPLEAADEAIPRYSRAPVIDALDLADPDRVALLRADEDGTGVLQVLAGIAPALWRAADAASIADLTKIALSSYGRPADDDARAHVVAAVDELVDAGALTTEVRWRIREDVAWVDHGKRVVALSLAEPSASPQALEGSAALIWRALDRGGRSSLAEIANRVAEEIDVESDAVIGDISAFIETLAASSLITRH